MHYRDPERAIRYGYGCLAALPFPVIALMANVTRHFWILVGILLGAWLVLTIVITIIAPDNDWVACPDR